MTPKRRVSWYLLANLLFVTVILCTIFTAECEKSGSGDEGSGNEEGSGSGDEGHEHGSGHEEEEGSGSGDDDEGSGEDDGSGSGSGDDDDDDVVTSENNEEEAGDDDTRVVNTKEFTMVPVKAGFGTQFTFSIKANGDISLNCVVAAPSAHWACRTTAEYYPKLYLVEGQQSCSSLPTTGDIQAQELAVLDKHSKDES